MTNICECTLKFAILPALLFIASSGVAVADATAANAENKPKAIKAADVPQETVITANRLEYEYSQSMIFFEENVKVEDPQFTMTSDRMTVFLDGTNNVNRVKASGHVVMINGDRNGRCQEAVYTKADGKIVMTGDVTLQNGDDKIWGKKITIWLDDQRMLCEPSRLVLQQHSIGEGKTKNGEEKRILP